MNPFDLLIGAVYLGLIWYVYQSIFEEVTKETEIKLDEEFLEKQLKERGLQEKLSISLKFSNSPLKETFNDFELKVENKTFTEHFVLHWNRSTLVDFDGVSQRLIRLPSTVNLDLYMAQASSAIAPFETLKEKVTIEGSLKLKEKESFIYEVTEPIFSTDLLEEAFEDDMIFEVTLMLQCAYADAPADASADAPNVQTDFPPAPVICRLQLSRKPWQKVLYWEPKSPKKASDNSKKEKAKKARKDYQQAKEDYRATQRK